MLDLKLLYAFVIGFSVTLVAATFLPASWWRYRSSHAVTVPIMSGRESLLSRLKQRVEHPRVKMSVSQYLMIAALSGFVIFVFSSFMLQSWWLGLPTFFAGILFTERFISMQRTRKKEKFEQGNIRALRLMASSLRTSPSYLNAFEQVASSAFVPAVVREEYGYVVEMLRSNVPLDVALKQLYVRTGSEDVSYISTVVTVQRDFGGDMAKTLDLAASSIVRKKQLQRRQKATLSQILAQVNMLSVMPFVFVFTLYFHNPHYFEPLTQTITGRLMMLGCFVSILLGGEAIRFVALRRPVGGGRK